MNMGRFKQTLQKVPEIHRPVSDSDAYTVLLEICMQHNLPIPKYALLKPIQILCRLFHNVAQFQV